MSQITDLIIHCSATPADMDIGVEQIYSWHVNGNGWKDVGYHFVLRRNGFWEQGRPVNGDMILDENEIGAHAYGHNHNSLGICIVGGGLSDQPIVNYTRAQWNSLANFVDVWMKQYNIAPDLVYGHRDVSDKWCPGFDVQAWMQEKNLK